MRFETVNLSLNRTTCALGAPAAGYLTHYCPRKSASVRIHPTFGHPVDFRPIASAYKRVNF